METPTPIEQDARKGQATLQVICGDALTELRKLPAESVHCCVTSPPYWGLRDYGTAQWEGGDDGCDHIRDSERPRSSRPLGEFHGGDDKFHETPFRESCGKCGAKRIDVQLGLEKTPEEYVGKLVEVFREVRRVLRKDGTLWLNLGDSYASDFKGSGGPSDKQLSNAGSRFNGLRLEHGLKPKDLCGIPWRVAFALQADGWWLRSDIIWAKPNPMPESVTDRPTKAHEYLFLLTKSANYFYDAEAIKEPNQVTADWQEPAPRPERAEVRNGLNPVKNQTGFYHLANPGAGRNKRSVWTVATAPYPESHFATYPPDLIKPCILAGTSAKGCCAKCGSPWERIVEREIISVSDSARYSGVSLRNDSEDGRTERASKTIGWQPTCECGKLAAAVRFNVPTDPCTVLDPFAGSGTTGMVALELGRKAILIELNPKYVELIRQRCDVTPGLALA